MSKAKEKNNAYRVALTFAVNSKCTIVLLTVIHWIAIYRVDGVIHPPNNLDQEITFDNNLLGGMNISFEEFYIYWNS